MNVEKLIENVMTKYKSSNLYGLIEYAILMDEEYHAKDINIDIIKKIIKIIDKPLSHDEIDFLEDDAKEFYDEISLELSEISSEDKEKVKEGLQYLINLYNSRKLIGERLHSVTIIDSTDRKNNIKEKQVYLVFQPNDKNLFKKLLIEKKQAKRTIYYKNGQTKTSYWNVRNFSIHSNLTANIKSSPLYKNAIENGIEKIIFEIEDCEDSIIFDNEQKKLFQKICSKNIRDIVNNEKLSQGKNLLELFKFVEEMGGAVNKDGYIYSNKKQAEELQAMIKEESKNDPDIYKTFREIELLNISDVDYFSVSNLFNKNISTVLKHKKLSLGRSEKQIIEAIEKIGGGVDKYGHIYESKESIQNEQITLSKEDFLNILAKYKR